MRIVRNPRSITTRRAPPPVRTNVIVEYLSSPCSVAFTAFGTPICFSCLWCGLDVPWWIATLGAIPASALLVLSAGAISWGGLKDP